MSVVIRNLQRAVHVNTRQLELDILLLKKICGYEKFEVGVVLVRNRYIRRLNERYRDSDEVTDVLAFPFHDEIKLNENNRNIILEDERMLGDIVLALAYILSESKKQEGEDFNSVLLTMVTHGLCHLIGFDHETQEQWEQMYKKEMDVLNKFNQITGHKCTPLLNVGH